jgi:uncharacterized membrane protein
MYTKDQIIAVVKTGLDENVVSKSDFDFILGVDKENTKKAHIYNLANIFYVIGGLIIILGAIIFVSMFWSDMGILSKMAVTLGIGLVAYVSGILLRKEQWRVLSQVSFTASAILIPSGIALFIQDADIMITPEIISVVSFVMFLSFLSAYFATGRNILIVLSTIFISSTYYASLNAMGIRNFDEYRIASLILALSFLLFNAFYLANVGSTNDVDRKEKKSVSNLIYLVSSFAIFGITLSFGQIADILMIVLLFAGFYAGIYLKSKTLLISSALFTMGYVVKISSQYFSDVLGWPLVLILIGASIVGIGLLTFKVNQKYITN